MDMKNTAILLILLFSILGLIIGVHYTVEDANDASQSSEDFYLKTENGSIPIHLEKNENESSLFDKLPN